MKLIVQKSKHDIKHASLLDSSDSSASDSDDSEEMELNDVGSLGRKQLIQRIGYLEGQLLLKKLEDYHEGTCTFCINYVILLC